VSLATERIESTAGFAALEGEWNALLAASAAPNVFLTWDWLYAWWTHLGAGRRLSVLAVRDGGELVAVAPLALAPPRLERLVPFRSLEFLGTGTAGSDYLDVFARRGREEAAVDAIADHLRRRRVMLQLGRVRRGAALAARVAERLAHRGWRSCEAPMEVCPFIDLRGRTWESYLATLGPAHRYNFHRRLRNLERAHATSFCRVTAEAERAPALERLLALHAARWRTRGGSDAFAAKPLVAFHEEVTRRALERGWLRLLELRLDGETSAALYGFRYGGVFSFYQSGFDPARAKDGVGLVTMGLSIRSAIEEGASEFDLLHGDEAYKFHWARETRPLARLELYPPRLHGLACRRAVELGRVARRTARRLLARLPPAPAAEVSEARP
jgi:CelD/BcsL family acetyltransferase involved in cellulose biosynthesis